MTQTPSRDWQKDMQRVNDAYHARTCVNQPFPRLSWQEMLPDPWEDVAGYWLQEAKERGEREQRLEEEIKEAMPFMREGMRTHFRVIIATLYPDTPAPTKTDGIQVKCIRDNYSGEGKLSFISGKTYEADKTDGDIIVVNEQGRRHIIKTDTGLHEFFGTYFEFITPAPKEGSDD